MQFKRVTIPMITWQKCLEIKSEDEIAIWRILEKAIEEYHSRWHSKKEKELKNANK